MQMDERELLFAPLGGAGEIGLNLNLYQLDGRWLMVDLGISFADEMLPGVEILLPDPGFIAERREQLAGLVLTHAHEDHLGAVPYLWERLHCPIWCTRFTAAVLRRKLAEGQGMAPEIHVVEPGEPFEIGPFHCELLHVTHSIPEAHALVLRTPLGTVLHTGDWKLDPAPMVGPTTAVEALEQLGKDGVLALVCDSTNIFDPGTSGSEAEVRDSLMELVASRENRVVITTFASNLARLETAIRVAETTGRHACAIGRSMRRMLEAAREVGYLTDVPALLDERAAAALAPEKVLWLATGCQGEPRAAMARIASGQHPTVRLDPGDSVIFSSKIIPGNERTLYNLHNSLVRSGIEVITEQDHFVHVSGHPCRDEVEQMYRWIKPEVAIPVHGEARHLHEHLALARRLGVRQPLEVANGDLVRIAPGPAEVIDDVPVGRLVLDDGKILTAGDELFRTRRRLSSHGTVVVGLVLDRYGSLLAAPNISVVGTVDLQQVEGGERGAVQTVEDAVEALDDEAALDDEQIRIAIRAALRRGLGLSRERRPIIEVQITRLGSDALAGLAEEAEAR